MSLAQIIWIVLDGGPCGGKSSAIAKIVDTLVKAGVMAVVVAEAATELINEGITPWDLGIVEFQRRVIERQLRNEARALAQAIEIRKKYGVRVAIICDRALLSGAAYMPYDDRAERLRAFSFLLAEFGLDTEEVRLRYPGVIHLVTAADGAEKFYTRKNNKTRKETPAQARDRDKRSLEAWLGHPHVALAPNIGPNGEKISFEDKVNRVVAEVFRILGLPVPIEDEQRFLVEPFDPKDFPVPYEAVPIEQTYLVSDEAGVEERVRVRTWLDSKSYIYTKKTPLEDGGDIETERLLSLEEYQNLLKRADPLRAPIQKVRHYFVWKWQYLEADIFKGRHEGEFRLEREKTEKTDTTAIPPFITVVRDITHDKSKRNKAMALIG